MTIQSAYEKLLTEPTDMMAHIQVLCECAAGKRVVEFGCRRGVSTMAMMSGFPIFLQTYDINRTEDVDTMLEMAKAEGIDLRFVQVDIDKLDSIPDCDFVFCDAHHNGNAVAINLRLGLAAGATKMASHDTAIFGRTGDLAGTPGILDAFDAFLAENKDWRICYQTDESHGMTIIEKIK
jgi:predicted O-methyltransferase YrrM